MVGVRRHHKLYLAFLLSCSVLLFVTPSNLFVKGPLTSAYVNGLLVDYLLPKLYLSDIFLGVSILLGGVALYFFYQSQSRLHISARSIKRLRSKQLGSVRLLLALAVTTFLLLTQLGSAHSVVALSQVFRIIAVSALAFLFYKLAKAHRLFDEADLSAKKLKKLGYWILFLAVILTCAFQASLATYQYVAQRELVGFRLLGEPHLTAPLGIVRQTSASGRSVILPYGSTAHPNVLAGCVVLYGLLAAWMLPFLQRHIQKQRVVLLILGFLSLWVVYLTSSVSAFLTFCVGWGILLWQRWHSQRAHSPNSLVALSKHQALLLLTTLTVLAVLVAPLTLAALGADVQNLSIQRRTLLQAAALKMFVQHPLAGVRLEHFPAFVERFAQGQEAVRFVQPVHNTLWLWLAETGILGATALSTWLAVLMQKLSRSEFLAFVLGAAVLLPIAVLDHYLLSLPSGILLTGWVLLFGVLILSQNFSDR